MVLLDCLLLVILILLNTQTNKVKSIFYTIHYKPTDLNYTIKKFYIIQYTIRRFPPHLSTHLLVNANVTLNNLTPPQVNDGNARASGEGTS